VPTIDLDNAHDTDGTSTGGVAVLTEPRPRRRRRIPSLGRYTGVVTALVVVCVYLGITQSVFLTWGNITNIVASNSVVLVLAIGATFVIISGGIDMSAAAATAACGMMLGIALREGLPAPVAILAPLAFGIVLGLVNGLLISYLKISFLVVTLGGLSIWSSFSLVVNDGATISVFSEDGFDPLYRFVNDDVAGVPYIMIFDVVLVLAAGAVLRYTAFGRALFAVGSNPEAARINGVNIDRVVLATYGVAGLTAGLAGLIQVGRLTGAAPSVDPTMLLTVIAAVLIGGTAFSGGEGGVLGTVIGVAFLGVVSNGLTLSEVSAFWQGTVNGLILILAVATGTARDRGLFRRLVPRERVRAGRSVA